MGGWSCIGARLALWTKYRRYGGCHPLCLPSSSKVAEPRKPGRGSAKRRLPGRCHPRTPARRLARCHWVGWAPLWEFCRAAGGEPQRTRGCAGARDRPETGTASIFRLQTPTSLASRHHCGAASAAHASLARSLSTLLGLQSVRTRCSGARAARNPPRNDGCARPWPSSLSTTGTANERRRRGGSVFVTLRTLPGLLHGPPALSAGTSR